MTLNKNETAKNNKYFSLMKENDIYCDNYIVNEKKYRYEKTWDIANTTTIIDWINNSNLYIFMLDTYLKDMRRLLRVNTLWSLMISSITSTISITQFTIHEETYPTLTLVVKAVIFITSLLTSIITGYIKVEKIQEKIELIDSNREKWMKFMTPLTNELQVSSKLRHNAEDLISSNRAAFNELSFKRIEIPKSIEAKVSMFLTYRLKSEISQRIHKRSSKNVYNCFMRPNRFKQYVEMTKQQLSVYKMTQKLMKSELLLLGKTYNNIISDITFKTETDLFEYRITTKSVQLLEKQINGQHNYSPISSDDEDSDDENENDNDDKINIERKDTNMVVINIDETKNPE